LIESAQNLPHTLDGRATLAPPWQAWFGLHQHVADIEPVGGTPKDIHTI